MVELCTRKREMGDEDDSAKDDTSGHDKLKVPLPLFGLEDLASLWLPAELGLVPAVSGMAN
jgi:hypothetical protein